MTQYLINVYRPNDCDSFFVEDDTMAREIDVLNDEMAAAGVRTFVGGLQSIRTAKSIQRQPDGVISTSDGPYLSNSAFVDGFWVLNVLNLDEALDWGRKAAAACRASIEVRPFH